MSTTAEPSSAVAAGESDAPVQQNGTEIPELPVPTTPQDAFQVVPLNSVEPTSSSAQTLGAQAAELPGPSLLSASLPLQQPLEQAVQPKLEAKDWTAGLMATSATLPNQSLITPAGQLLFENDQFRQYLNGALPNLINQTNPADVLAPLFGLGIPQLGVNVPTMTAVQKSEPKKRGRKQQAEAEGDKPKKRHRSKKPPDAPRRPKSAYMFFLAEFREKWKEDNPDSKKVADVARAAGEVWRVMPEEQKADYESRSTGAKMDYAKAIHEYEQEHPKPPRKQIKLRAPGELKRPQSAYFFFLADFRDDYKKLHPGEQLQVSVIGKLAGEKWKSMPDEEKAPYEKLSNESKAEYAKLKTLTPDQRIILQMQASNVANMGAASQLPFNLALESVLPKLNRTLNPLDISSNPELLQKLMASSLLSGMQELTATNTVTTPGALQLPHGQGALTSSGLNPAQLSSLASQLPSLGTPQFQAAMTGLPVFSGAGMAGISALQIPAIQSLHNTLQAAQSPALLQNAIHTAQAPTAPTSAPQAPSSAAFLAATSTLPMHGAHPASAPLPPVTTAMQSVPAAPMAPVVLPPPPLALVPPPLPPALGSLPFAPNPAIPAAQADPAAAGSTTATSGIIGGLPGLPDSTREA